MKKIILIMLSFFIFGNFLQVSAKCSGFAYIFKEHYYNNDGNFCEEGESVGNFMALNKNLSLDEIWDGTEYTFLANTYKKEKDFIKSRVVLNGKTLLELKYKSEYIYAFSNYSLSGKHIFTGFGYEGGTYVNPEDKDTFGVYIDSKKVFENGLGIDWKHKIYKEYGFLVDFSYNNLFLDFKELKKIDYLSEKIKEMEKTEKEKYKNILRNELKKHVDEEMLSLKYKLKFEETKRAYVSNYLLQEIVIDELLKERK